MGKKTMNGCCLTVIGTQSMGLGSSSEMDLAVMGQFSH
jgi:hypothetical protein